MLWEKDSRTISFCIPCKVMSRLVHFKLVKERRITNILKVISKKKLHEIKLFGISIIKHTN